MLKNLTCSRCINYLTYVFGKGHIVIFLGDIKTTPIQLLLELPGLTNILAKSIGPVKFYGGPPTKRKEYTGTLLTFLQDNILNATPEQTKMLQ